MTDYRKEGNFEKPANTFNGIAMLLLLIALSRWRSSRSRRAAARRSIVRSASAIVFVAGGFFMLQPNEAGVLTLFGDYLGTERTPGLRWTWPWIIRKKVSVRARNHNVETLKVNDKRGNPVEIAAVVVWRVEDTAQALFDVDDFEHFVQVQSESALRHVATRYNYDEGEEHEASEVTLRAGADVVADALCEELQARVQLAGVKIEEAKLTHLAYAPEIAGAMLRRQQAEAVIAARTQDRHGRGGHGGDGAEEPVGEERRGARRRAPRRDGLEPDGGALLGARHPARSSTPARSTPEDAAKEPVAARRRSCSASTRSRGRDRAPRAGGAAHGERADRVPAARGARQARHRPSAAKNARAKEDAMRIPWSRRGGLACVPMQAGLQDGGST